MNEQDRRPSEPTRHKSSATWLTGLGLASAVIYGLLSFLSHSFQFGADRSSRPIPEVIFLFVVLFVLYLVATRRAAKSGDARRTVLIVVGAAVLFRAIFLFSHPIQEVDIYRYLWDGAVTNCQISPFLYSPQTVVDAVEADNDHGQLPDPLARLTQVCRADPELFQVVQRVHWKQVRTVYPPVSQVVFAGVHRVTPRGTSVRSRMQIMRAVIVLFDLATIPVVLGLLRLANLPRTLITGYAWCPLLIKEIANSGHLDSITVLVTTVGIYCLIRSISVARESQGKWSASGISPGWCIAGCFSLALGVGAKVYPIVLLPWAVALCWRRSWLAIAGPLVFVVVAWLVIRPMLIPAESQEDPAATVAAEQDDVGSGLEVFTKYWEMNDLLFMIVVENLKPDPQPPSKNVVPWFVLIPNVQRVAFTRAARRFTGWQPHLTPFLSARLITGAIFALVAVGLAVWARRQDSPIDWIQAAFLTIAWFWLLGPTQNPWYWTWALPLLPMMQSKAWWAMSGILFTYYWRFWFEYQFAGGTVAGTGYSGTQFFDFVVTWFEFAPWFAFLLATWIAGPRSAANVTTPDSG